MFTEHPVNMSVFFSIIFVETPNIKVANGAMLQQSYTPHPPFIVRYRMNKDMCVSAGTFLKVLSAIEKCME